MLASQWKRSYLIVRRQIIDVHVQFLSLRRVLLQHAAFVLQLLSFDPRAVAFAFRHLHCTRTSACARACTGLLVTELVQIRAAVLVLLFDVVVAAGCALSAGVSVAAAVVAGFATVPAVARRAVAAGAGGV